MKNSCLQDNLKLGLEIVSKAVAKKSTLPILETVKLFTENGRLGLSTSNLDMAVIYYVAGSIEKDATICVPHTSLTKLISALSPERIDLEVYHNAEDKQHLTLGLSCGATITQFRGMDSLDFPILPEVPEKDYITVDVHKFIEAVKAVEFCAQANDDRPILNSVYLQYVDNKLKFTAVNGFQLGHKEIDVQTAQGIQEFNTIVPVDLINDACWMLQKYYGKNDGEISILVNDLHLFIVADRFEIFIYTREGAYPDYLQIVPSNTDVSAIVDPTSLRNAIKRATAVMEKRQTVSIEIKPALFYVRATGDGVKQHTVLDAVVEGEITTYVEKDQLDSILAHLPNPKNVWSQVKLSLNSRKLLDFQAIKIESVQDNSVFYLLMTSKPKDVK